MGKRKPAEGAEGPGAAGTGGAGVSFEKELARLEEIVGKLEGEMPGLDEAIRLYEEGAGCLKACQQRLAGAEARIKALVEGAGGPELTDFDAESAGEPPGARAGADAGGESGGDGGEEAPPARRERRPRGRGLF
jgi:exodeoxyribonuclease VII small subunit